MRLVFVLNMSSSLNKDIIIIIIIITLMCDKVTFRFSSLLSFHTKE